MLNPFENEDQLAIPDPNKIYRIYYMDHSKITLLMKLVMLTHKDGSLNNHIEKYIKENPKEINKRSTKGWTALMFSVRSYKFSTLKTVQLLLKNGADPNIPDMNYMNCINNGDIY